MYCARYDLKTCPMTTIKWHIIFFGRRFTINNVKFLQVGKNAHASNSLQEHQ
jgi:hypothetical protein